MKHWASREQGLKIPHIASLALSPTRCVFMKLGNGQTNRNAKSSQEIWPEFGQTEMSCGKDWRQNLPWKGKYPFQQNKTILSDPSFKDTLKFAPQGFISWGKTWTISRRPQHWKPIKNPACVQLPSPYQSLFPVVRPSALNLASSPLRLMDESAWILKQSSPQKRGKVSTS